jgi:hypothetical protein
VIIDITPTVMGMIKIVLAMVIARDFEKERLGMMLLRQRWRPQREAAAADNAPTRADARILNWT